MIYIVGIILREKLYEKSTLASKYSCLLKTLHPRESFPKYSGNENNNYKRNFYGRSQNEKKNIFFALL